MSLAASFAFLSAAELVGAVPHQSRAPSHRISERHKFEVME
jgi:hypothetical protein